MNRAVGVAWVALLLLAGCSAPRHADETLTVAPVTSDGWVRTGPVAMATEGDTSALRISGIASVHSDSITSIVISFVDGKGAPAAHPAVSRVVFRPEVRVVRVQLPRSVASWAFTQKSFETGLVSAAYVVRCLDRTIALDLHLAESASVRASFGDATAPLTVTLRRGGLPLPPPAPPGSTVLLWPRLGDDADTLAIEGYSRPFEANLEVHLVGASPRDTYTSTADYIETFGEFRLRLPRGARGSADTLKVGDPNMETGAWQGVSLPLSRH